MKGFRFYEELENKNRKGETSKGSVVAVAYENRTFTGDYEGACGVFDGENPPVCWSGIGWEYLEKCTRRISEERARQIHPALFEYLEME